MLFITTSIYGQLKVKKVLFQLHRNKTQLHILHTYITRSILFPDSVIKVNKSLYIALFMVNGSIKKLFSIDCVNIYFPQWIVLPKVMLAQYFFQQILPGGKVIRRNTYETLRCLFMYFYFYKYLFMPIYFYHVSEFCKLYITFLIPFSFWWKL